ncbi:MAG: D-alanyl-D-alanine carboxypeptidase/D-alanyl-D-alanine-endopeptidase [Hydrogenophaga sp.]|nr:D-alanyl-D-alanine carboxypeptidase/D-alanyl-D-alanine-endopeptidase [Hydrogenophaga sp.]
MTRASRPSPALAGFPRAAALLLALAALSLPACAQRVAPADPLPPTVSRALQRAQVPASALSAYVVALDDRGDVRLRHQAGEPVNPASVMKLVTSYAALDLLGSTHTWTTRFLTDGVIDNGALRGNLYVRGGGDPKLVIERLQEAYAALQAQGVNVILGDLVLDHSAFDLPEIDPGAFDGEALRPYNASPDALLFNFKSVILKFQPDPAAGVARVVSEPPMAGLAIDPTVPLAPGRCSDWRGGLGARFDDPDSIRFTGRYPAACGELAWPVAYQQPGTYAVRAFEGAWRAMGGLLTGQARSGLTPPQARLLHEARSLPLADILIDVNQWSNNVMAQQVFLSLGDVPLAPEAGAPAGRRSSFERARAVVGQWWQRTFGPKVAAPVMENGSGLSRVERITPEALAVLLRHAARHAQAQPFVQSLAVAGVSGTAARIARDPRSPAYGNAFLKTGTLRDVTGLAGYVNAANGSRYAVVGFVNHPNAGAARPALEALVEWVAAQPD